MHTYVLASFVVNCICLAITLAGVSFTKEMSGSVAVACAMGVVSIAWAAVLLFGA